MRRSLLGVVALVALYACDEPVWPGDPAAKVSAPEADTSVGVTHKGLPFRQVSAGGEHTCGVTTSNVAYCWGQNSVGQLGNGSRTGPETCAFGFPCSTRPIRVVGGLAFREISAHGGFDGHTCGVTTANVAYCWGGNASGQLGTGTTSNSLRPVRVAGGLSFRQLSAGSHHSCGVTTSNVVYCWGENQSGQLGIGTTTNRTRPVRVAGALQFRHVIAGEEHTCAVTTSNVAYCWGNNLVGQLGTGTNAGPEKCEREFLGPVACSTRPVRVAGGLPFRHVTASSQYSCGVTTSSVAYCWGSNILGALGDGTTTDRLRPARVAGGLQFRRVNAGGNHTCGATTTNVAYCWGANAIGQLGNGSNTGPERCIGFDEPCSTRPVRVAGGLSFRGVQAEGVYSCGVTTSNVAYCWGYNAIGQLGAGTSTGPEICADPFAGDRPCSRRPVRVVSPTH